MATCENTIKALCLVLTRSIACSSRAEFSVQSKIKMCEAAVRFRPAMAIKGERKIKSRLRSYNLFLKRISEICARCTVRL